jgi:hypothetical protein
VKNSSTQKSDEGDCSSYNNDTCEASIGWHHDSLFSEE